MPTRSVTISALLLLASGASAADKKPTPAPMDPNKKVCVSETQTGSIFSKRVCHTAAEWDAIHAAGRRQADTIGSDVGGRLQTSPQ